MPPFIVILLLCSSWCAATVVAAEHAPPDLGLPVVRRTEFAEAPMSGPVVAMAETSDGTRWVGSNLLAAHDGLRWETIDLPNAYAFRGLAPDSSGRLWVGAIGAVGFLARDRSHRWQFTSLLPDLLRSGGPDPGDIWHVFALGKGAVFVTTEWILRWNGQVFDCWRYAGRTRLQAFARGEVVLLYQEGVGLLRLAADGDPVLETPEAKLPEHPLTWHVALPGDEALLGLGDSAYRRTSAGDLALLPELSETLRGTLPSSAICLKEDLVAIGTLKHGVVFANAAGASISAINEATGLGDDSVHGLSAGPGATLWVGLSNGAASIEPPDRVTAFDSRSGFKGTPLKVLNVAGQPSALTSKTVYEFTADGPAFTLGPLPRLWDAAVVGDNLWAGGFGGLWRKDALSWIHEYHVSNDVPCLTAIKALPHSVVFVEGYALKSLRAGPYGWVANPLGPSVADTPLSLIEDQAGDLWVSTVVGGIYRFAWSPSDASRPPQLHLVAHYRSGHGLPLGAARPQLTRLGDRVFAFSAAGILELNHAGTAFQPVKELSEFIGLSAATPSTADPSSAYWLVQSRLLGTGQPPAILQVRLEKDSSLPLRVTPVHAAGLDTCKQPTRIDLVESPSGAALWIGDSPGLLRIPLAGLIEEPGPPLVKLHHVQSGEVLLSLDHTAAPFSNRTGNLTFHFRAETPRGDRDIFYQSRLEETDAAWSVPSPLPAREYHGLAPGNRTFSVRAVDRFGRVGPPAHFVFTIAPPWYRSSLAFAAYGLSTAAAGLGLARWRTARLRRLNERLNQLVTERTRELELSNTAKSEFLENVSHEIRNPLNGLTGMLSLLQEGDLKPRERELAQSLKACAQNLTRVSEEVLDYSKLEYGYVTLRSRPFTVRQLFTDLVDLFRGPALREGADLKIELSDTFVDGFVGDDDKISTILGNFISNALKYAPGSPVELTADAHDADGGMVDLFFEVTDHGPGVPASEQELVFQKFVRGSAAKKSQAAGAGLGLATCRMLAKAMNGSVGLESPESGGSTFYLRILVTRTAPPALRETAQEEAPSGTGGRALIVEDEPYNQTVLQGVALDLNYSPTLAANGPEALAALAGGNFDVVFLDWELPGAKGGEIARQVRLRANGAEPIVIATTAHDSEEIRLRCAEAGMDGFLLKPYSKERIRTMIAAVYVRRKRGASELIESVSVPSPELNLAAFLLYNRGLAEKRTDARHDYIVAVEKELALLRVSETPGNLTSIRGAAHRLRALAGLIGAQDLSRIAGQLEMESPQHHPLLLQQLTTAWDQLKSRLGLDRTVSG